MRRALSSAIYFLSATIGVLAFVYPLLLEPQVGGSIGIAHGRNAPLVTTAS